MELPLVSIILLNYNNTPFTIDCLKSLNEITYKNVEVIVVDNASREDPTEALKAVYPDVVMVMSKDNLGYAGGNNLGTEAARGKHVLFLNNDTEVEPEFLEPLVAKLESDPSIGMVSPKIIYYDTDNLIQYAGSAGINPYTGRGTKIGHLEPDDGKHDTSTPTQLVHGAALLAPMEAIEKVGLMPDIFFIYYEEHDWCERFKRNGYKMFYVAESKIYHKESATVGRISPMKSYYMTRNRLMFIRRNNQGLTFLASLMFFLFLTVPKHTVMMILKGDFDLLKSFWRGLVWNLGPHDVKHNPMLENAGTKQARIVNQYTGKRVKFI